MKKLAGLEVMSFEVPVERAQSWRQRIPNFIKCGTQATSA